VRFQIIAELAAGDSQRNVAKLLHVAPSTVSRTARSYLAMGVAGLFDQRTANGPTKADDQFQRELVAVLEKSPTDFGWSRPTWTRELLCTELERRGFERVAVCTMGRALRAIGARLGAAKPIVLCPWPSEKRKKQLRFLRNLAKKASATEPVYYEDEVDIDLNPRIGRDWMLKGQQRRIVTPGKNQKHYVAGALNAKTRKLVWVEHPSKNSALFCKLLWRLLQRHRRARRIHLILDNYIIHKSAFTDRVLRSLNGKIKLHFLPPYCPDDNPIERVWRDMHAAVTRNHRCRTFPELCSRVADFLNGYDGRRALNPALQPRLARAA
jgi:transposase